MVNPCTASSVSVSGSYTIQDVSGNVREVFTLRPNDSSNWLRPGRCNVVTTNQNRMGSPVEDLGIATSSVVPGVPAPSGTMLNMFFFDSTGQRIGDASIPITGAHNASFPVPPQFSGKLVIVFCLEGPASPTEIDLTPVKLVQQGGSQFDNARHAEGVLERAEGVPLVVGSR